MLQELCHLAEREQLLGDTAFEVRPVAWIIELKANGDFIGFSGTHQPEELPEPKKGAKPKKPKEFAKKFLIPRQFNLETGGTRTSGDYAYFLVDKSDYALGCVLETKANIPPTDKKLLNRLELFTGRVRECLTATGAKGLQAVVTFLDRVRTQGLPVDLPEKAAPGDLFAFMVRPALDEFVHDDPAVQDYSRGLCGGGKQAESQDWQCLITGKEMAEPSLFPMVKRVPGGRAQTGVVSFNSPAFESYGWDSNANAPVSAEAAQAAAVAMNRLLDPAFQRQDGKVLLRRNIRISEDTVACYWAREASGDELADGLPGILQGDDGGKPRELWKAVWKGKPPAELDKTKFYAVTLTGAQGRAIVRDWYETTVGEVQASVAKYFEQLAIEPNTYPAKGKELPPVFALRTLQECLVPSCKADDLPSRHAAELFAACINQRLRFPSSLLGMALERMRAEAGGDEWLDSYRRDARTGLIKAILIRNHNLNLTPTMDETNTQPGYLLGRLFACIERMQSAALESKDKKLNSNIANRYFAAASRNPGTVVPKLLEDVNGHYFKKALRKAPGTARMLQRHIGEIHSAFQNIMDPEKGYPTTLQQTQQGLFMIGYHVQKHQYQKSRDKGGDTSGEKQAEEDAEGEEPNES